MRTKSGGDSSLNLRPLSSHDESLPPPSSHRRRCCPSAAECRRGRGSHARLAQLTAKGPITYPESLPITERRDELIAAIQEHQVIIVAGETGSGKSTQLPKLCLDAGRGVDGLIGHTQPRRVAARTVAERIAEELGTPVGEGVGYTVRFNDQVSAGTLLRVMTDGILLNELQRDRMLSKYDTLIIDEAHERSLNIDFILGYVKQLLPQRPDLKVIVTSATIDTERFAEHFAGPTANRRRSSSSRAAPTRSRPAIARMAPTTPTILATAATRFEP